MEMLSLSPVKRKRYEEEEYEKETPKRIKWQLIKKTAATASPPKQSFVVQQQLGDLLQAVEKEELIRIITCLTANDSILEDRVASLLPRPTLALTLQILQNLEVKLLDAIPYSKLGPDRSDYSFNRIRPQMNELQGSLLQYLDFFTLPVSYPSSLSHEYPSEAFGYLNETTKLVHRLPIWESEEKTKEFKVPLYERLGMHWRICVNEVSRRVNDGISELIIGKVFGSHVVGEWAHNLAFHNTQVNGKFGFKEAMDEFVKNLGWIIGLEGGMEQLTLSKGIPLGMGSGF